MTKSKEEGEGEKKNCNESNEQSKCVRALDLMIHPNVEHLSSCPQCVSC